MGIATKAPDQSGAEPRERATFWLIMVGAVVMLAWHHHDPVGASEA